MGVVEAGYPVKGVPKLGRSVRHPTRADVTPTSHRLLLRPRQIKRQVGSLSREPADTSFCNLEGKEKCHLPDSFGLLIVKSLVYELAVDGQGRNTWKRTGLKSCRKYGRLENCMQGYNKHPRFLSDRIRAPRHDIQWSDVLQASSARLLPLASQCPCPIDDRKEIWQERRQKPCATVEHEPLIDLERTIGLFRPAVPGYQI